MKWNNINLVIEYIENNLDDEIDEKSIENMLGCSYHYFQKAFFYITGVSLPEYIRKRRLTQAAFELQTTSNKVIDIALKYGYDSPTAFTRAFKKMFQVAPKDIRNSQIKLISYLPLNIELSLEKNNCLEYKIIKQNYIRIVGRKLTTNIKDNDYYSKITNFWKESSCHIGAMLNYNNQLPKGIIATASGEWDIKGKFDYYIGVASEVAIKDSELMELIIPESSWIVFEITGPMPFAIREGYKQIFCDWFPRSGYQYRDLPVIELYPSGNISDENYKTQIWIAIKES